MAEQVQGPLMELYSLDSEAVEPYCSVVLLLARQVEVLKETEVQER
jgi:hypothetical protein